MTATAPTNAAASSGSVKQVPGLVNGMRYRTLGDSDLLVSEVTLGTMTWGQQNTDEEAMQQMNRAFDHYGINTLDTAELYPVPSKAETQGRTDLAVAKFLKTRSREEVVLCTKVCGRSDMGWFRDAEGGTSVTRSQIMESVDKSLARLGTDYIDLLQIHWPDRYVPKFGAGEYDRGLETPGAVQFEEQLRAMQELVQAGKVRHIGVSNETPFGVSKMCELAAQYPHEMPKIVSIQNSYSMLVRKDFESGLSEVCSPLNYNVGLLAYSPLAGGVLTAKYEQPQPPEEARMMRFKGYMERYRNSPSQAAVRGYAEVAAAHGLTPAQLALAWCYNRQAVTSTIIGATSVEQMNENIEALDIELSEEAIKGINEVYLRHTDPTKRY